MDFRKFVRFLVAGAPGVLSYYGVLYILTDYFDVWYVLSSVIASGFNIGLNFILHKYWTFKVRDKKNMRKQIVVFFLFSGLVLVANSVFLFILVDLVHMDYLMAQIPPTIILGIISYFVTKKILVV